MRIELRGKVSEITREEKGGSVAFNFGRLVFRRMPEAIGENSVVALVLFEALSEIVDGVCFVSKKNETGIGISEKGKKGRVATFEPSEELRHASEGMVFELFVDGKRIMPAEKKGMVIGTGREMYVQIPVKNPLQTYRVISNRRPKTRQERIDLALELDERNGKGEILFACKIMFNPNNLPKRVAIVRQLTEQRKAIRDAEQAQGVLNSEAAIKFYMQTIQVE